MLADFLHVLNVLATSYPIVFMPAAVIVAAGILNYLFPKE